MDPWKMRSTKADSVEKRCSDQNMMTRKELSRSNVPGSFRIAFLVMEYQSESEEMDKIVAAWPQNCFCRLNCSSVTEILRVALLSAVIS